MSDEQADMVEGLRKEVAGYVAMHSRLGTPTTFEEALRGHRRICQENLRDEGEYGASVWSARLTAIDTLAWQEGIKL